MSRWIKRTSLGRGEWWLAVNCLCWALLILLFVATNFARAAPLPRVDVPAEVSDVWTYKWLVGVMTYSVGPSDDLSEAQKREWWIGYLVGVAELCGHTGIARNVRLFMKKSPYFQKALSDMQGFDFAKSCGRHMTPLQKVLGQKEDWEYYLGVNYPDG